eukprot:865973-Rhodomonas_salina.2
MVLISRADFADGSDFASRQAGLCGDQALALVHGPAHCGPPRLCAVPRRDRRSRRRPEHQAAVALRPLVQGQVIVCVEPDGTCMMIVCIEPCGVRNLRA